MTETVPLAGGPDPDDWRAALPARYPAVSGFLKVLPAVIEFGPAPRGRSRYGGQESPSPCRA